jgi:hypothetical protein
MAEQHAYFLKGHIIGACNCDWGCPCSFQAPPTYGGCDGNYNWHITQGHYGNVPLDGLNFSIFSRFPEAVHKGNGTGVILIDECATPAQRTAMETMATAIPPFSIFHSLLSTFLGFRYVPYDLHLNGIHSRLSIPRIAEVALTPMKNPVTGEDDLATLYKPTGLTSKEHELCSTERYAISIEGLSYDHRGKYGEFSPFEYMSA